MSHTEPRSWIWGPIRWFGGAQQLLFDKVFAKMHGWGSRGTPHTLYAPHTWGVGYQVNPPPRTFPTLRTTSVPNYILNPPAVWNPIENIHTNQQTNIALYVLDTPKIISSNKPCFSLRRTLIRLDESWNQSTHTASITRTWERDFRLSWATSTIW